MTENNDEYVVHAVGPIKGDGFEYYGGLKDGKPHGYGHLICDDARYQGEFLNGTVHGYGVLSMSPDGGRYEGSFRNNDFDGMGSLVYPCGGRIDGEWRAGKHHGRCTYLDEQGRIMKECMFFKDEETLDGFRSIELHDLTEDDPTECCICMNAFMDSDVIIKTECNHVFHNSCSTEWFGKHGTCPVCRKQRGDAMP